MAAGKKTGGRKAGTPNALSGLAKDNIASVFNRLGGTVAMAVWARENQTQFYQIYAKLLPVDVKHGGDENNPVRQAIEISIVDPAH